MSFTALRAGRGRPRPALALCLLAALLPAAGCAQRLESECCPCPEEKPLEQDLMLVLASARALHHQADIHLQQGQVDRAIEAVRGILALGLDPKWPEAEEARLDAVARLAKLLQSRGEEQEALDLADREIRGARRESFYLSNLHSVRGEILQARSKRLDGEGKKEEARASAREAIAAFERSIAINKRLQQQQLRGGGGR
jgi:tetratricopeptide (TPR) repeat protein